jgi:hypothetical protein
MVNRMAIEKQVSKMETLFGLLEAEGVVEKVDANGEIRFRVVQGREVDYIGVMGFLMITPVGGKRKTDFKEDN